MQRAKSGGNASDALGGLHLPQVDVSYLSAPASDVSGCNSVPICHPDPGRGRPSRPVACSQHRSTTRICTWQHSISDSASSHRASQMAHTVPQPQPGHNQMPGRKSGTASRLAPAPIADMRVGICQVLPAVPASLQREKQMTPARARHSSVLGPCEQTGLVLHPTWKDQHPACQGVRASVPSRSHSASFHVVIRNVRHRPATFPDGWSTSTTSLCGHGGMSRRWYTALRHWRFRTMPTGSMAGACSSDEI